VTGQDCNTKTEIYEQPKGTVQNHPAIEQVGGLPSWQAQPPQHDDQRAGVQRHLKPIPRAGSGLRARPSPEKGPPPSHQTQGWEVRQPWGSAAAEQLSDSAPDSAAKHHSFNWS